MIYGDGVRDGEEDEEEGIKHEWKMSILLKATMLLFRAKHAITPSDATSISRPRAP